jgi:hypothetical protein
MPPSRIQNLSRDENKMRGADSAVKEQPEPPVNNLSPYPWQITKKDLVGSLQVLLHTGRIKIARSLEHADTCNCPDPR